MWAGRGSGSCSTREGKRLEPHRRHARGADELADLQLGRLADGEGAIEGFQHALRKSKVFYGPCHLAVFDEERAVASHPGDDGKLRMHDPHVPEARDPDAA